MLSHLLHTVGSAPQPLPWLGEVNRLARGSTLQRNANQRSQVLAHLDQTPLPGQPSTSAVTHPLLFGRLTAILALGSGRHVWHPRGNRDILQHDQALPVP